MQYRIVFISSVMALALLCAGSPPEAGAQDSSLPGWVNDPSEAFSEDRYLMAVGSSPSREGARIQAQSNLAKIFVSNVKVEENYVNQFKEISTSEGDGGFEETTELITNSEVGSNQQMKNVQIMEIHEDKKGTFYALAAMDRRETARLYTEEINNKWKAVAALRKKAEETDRKLERLIYMKQAMLNARINKMLMNQRSILTGRATQSRGPQMSDIMQEYRQAKQLCTVSLEAESVSEEITSAIQRELQNEGFTITNDDQPVITMNISMMMKPVDLGRPKVEFMNWSLQVEAKNEESGQWFSTYKADGREGGISRQQARNAVTHVVTEQIASEFSSFINNELLSVE